MKKKIVILSAYHRAIWLSTELKSKGHDVCYLDFSQRLGGLSPEAWDPPFGIFSTPKMSYSQNICINEGAEVREVKQGFTVLSDRGPIEFQGPLHKKSFERYGIDQDQLDYIHASSTMGEESFLKFKYHFKKEKFENIWMLHLLHQLADATYCSNISFLDHKNRPLPALENWSLRNISRREAEDVLQMTESRGVEVCRVKNIQNTFSTSNHIERIEVTNFSDVTKKIEGDLFLSFLSQEELSIIHPKTFSNIIGLTPVAADWFWTRYRIFTNQSDVTEYLPKAFVLLDDKFLSWTHHNLLLVQRGLRSNEFVVWCRIPTNYRLQQNLLESTGQDIKNIFIKHFVGAEVQQMELPLECLATEFQVLAPHLPIFAMAKTKKSMALAKANDCTAQTRLKNVLWCGPECWQRLDATYMFEHQENILNKICKEQDQQGISRRRGRDQEIYS